MVSIAKAQIKREVLSIKFDWVATHEALSSQVEQSSRKSIVATAHRPCY